MSIGFSQEVARHMSKLKQEMNQAAMETTQILINEKNIVLSGRRSGRIYRVPGTIRAKYQASAPGEAPAVATGNFRNTWHEDVRILNGGNFTVQSSIKNQTSVGGHLQGDILEHGTRSMAPRPYQQEIKQRALKKALKRFRDIKL